MPHLCPRWRLLSGSQLRMCIPQPRANWEATAARRQFPVLSYRRRQVAGQRGQRVPQLCEASVCLIFFSMDDADPTTGGGPSTGIESRSLTEASVRSLTQVQVSAAGGGPL